METVQQTAGVRELLEGLHAQLKQTDEFRRCSEVRGQQCFTGCEMDAVTANRRVFDEVSLHCPNRVSTT